MPAPEICVFAEKIASVMKKFQFPADRYAGRQIVFSVHSRLNQPIFHFKSVLLKFIRKVFDKSPTKR
jgi:hypothetical protein